MKEHLHFALKVAIAMVIIGAVTDLIARFAGINLKPWLTQPLATAGVLPTTGG